MKNENPNWYIICVKCRFSFGVKINTKLFREVITYLNILVGIYISDYFKIEELEEKIIKKIDNLLMIMNGLCKSIIKICKIIFLGYTLLDNLNFKKRRRRVWTYIFYQS